MDVFLRMPGRGMSRQRGSRLDAGSGGHDMRDEGVAGAMKRDMLLDARLPYPFVQHTQAIRMRRQLEHPVRGFSALQADEPQGTVIHVKMQYRIAGMRGHLLLNQRHSARRNIQVLVGQLLDIAPTQAAVAGKEDSTFCMCNSSSIPGWDGKGGTRDDGRCYRL